MSRVVPPPSLEFGSWSRNTWLAIWAVVVFENSLLPAGLYYGLRYGTQLKLWTICTIITSIWGIVFYIEYAMRIWRLIRRSSSVQPLNSTSGIPQFINNENQINRSSTAPSCWYLDATHWISTLTLTVTLAELIISTVQKKPHIKLLAMVNPSILYSIFLSTLLLDLHYLAHAAAPFRISSVAKGEHVRPGIYTLLEDVISVHYYGNSAFRRQINERWRASPGFRKFLIRLSLFWSIPGLVIAIGCTVIVFTTPDELGFAIAWVVPFLWATAWIPLTALLIFWGLKMEREEWFQLNNQGDFRVR